MSDQSAGAGPEDRTGWRPDPVGRFEERFLVRGRWTRRVRWGDAEAVDLQELDAEGAPPTDWQRRPGGSSQGDQGWREDPTGRFPERWWDGSSFTRKVRVGGAVATDTVVSPPSGRRSEQDREGEGRPPGWAEDPTGDGQRYWDGHQWTAKWRAAPSGSPDHSLRGWWSRSLLLALGVLAAVLVVVLAVLVVILL